MHFQARSQYVSTYSTHNCVWIVSLYLITSWCTSVQQHQKLWIYA